MPKQSRFEKITKKRSEKNIALILLGTIVIIIIFFFYGIPILVNFSLFLMNFNNRNTEPTLTQNDSYLTTPVLDPLPDATNSARIDISGNASSSEKVKIYLNNKYREQTSTDKDQNFVFNNVLLKEGINSIKVQAMTTNSQLSDYSQVSYVTYKTKAPYLQIDFPQNGQTITGSSRIKVTGKSDTDTKITINNYWAIVDNTGNFSYFLNLQNGENKIKIEAVDEAGNQNTKDITVTLNP